MATPIGNLGDLSPRAREVLAAVDLVLAEDTRRARKLLNHCGIVSRTRAFHDHNEEREQPRILALLEEGKDVALVSDAGTPLLADPGFRLVRSCREHDVRVLAIPGPSAVTAALAVAGLPPHPATFAGFLPAAAAARERLLAALAPLPHTLVLFLSPHRLRGELMACADVLGAGRDAALLAELTKVHERCARGSLAVLATCEEAERPRGEYTLVVGPPAAVETSPPTARAARAALDRALASGLSLADARREAAKRLGVSRRALYDLLLTSE